MEEKSVNKTNSNAYTFTFAIIMVIVVGVILAFAATSLQPRQYENMRIDKMQSILATVGIQAEKEEAQELFDQYITEQVVLDSQGEEREGVNAFDVDLAKELKKSAETQNLPLYVANVEGEDYYIVPLRGSGLWNAIFGYIALKDDVNTVKGATFDHLGETPGLGALITEQWFRERFAEKQIFDDTGNLVGVSVVKGGSVGDPNKVDAISGATITGDGVSDMISERLGHYLPYFRKQADINVPNN